MRANWWIAGAVRCDWVVVNLDSHDSQPNDVNPIAVCSDVPAWILGSMSTYWLAAAKRQNLNLTFDNINTH